MVHYTICRQPARPRYLPLRYAGKALAINAFASTPEELEPGQERLYSYYEPSLTAGPHVISTKQEVVQDSKHKLPFQDEQRFNVVAPRYTLPEGSVHSVYPPQGHTENVEILPHVVLNDPHLPWTRRVRLVQDPVKERNRVPWLAVLTFTQEELQAPELGISQSNTLSSHLSLSGLAKLNCSTPALDESGSPRDGDDASEKADFIFLKKDLFRVFFGNDGAASSNYDVSKYEWLAHMRHINTIGMANSGIDGEKGSFGVVISQRAGALNVTEPTDLMVHLVSIENVTGLDYQTTKDRVALCSLASWSYTCLPPKSFNVVDGFRHIGSTLEVLRLNPSDIVKNIVDEEVRTRVRDRLTDGYVMTHYRTQTGEKTAAWMRGPLVPTIVKHIERPASRSGTDLQVLDQKLGIVDISYSTAWQLGKTMALADQAFATALGRLRLIVSRTATHEAKKVALTRAGVFQDHYQTLTEPDHPVANLLSLDTEGILTGADLRWRHPQTASLDLSRSSLIMKQQFKEQVVSVVERLTRARNEARVYNEFNEPNSPDWMIVLSWVLDRMYLAGIPYQYYLPDPAYLPMESLKFFHIDRNWVDALIDGALSIANHLPNDDVIPGKFKHKINEYLKHHPEGLNYPPQRPCYGFLLRSELCVKFPDLIVEAYRKGRYTPDPSLILRQENIAEGVLLVMTDQKPGGDVFEKLVFREPPHQQAFAAGTKLSSTSLDVAYKKIYTIPFAEQEKRQDRKSPITRITHQRNGGDETPIFNWDNDANSLRPQAYANQVHKILKRDMPTNDYLETDATSTLMGIQLNHPMYFLEIGLNSTLFPALSHIHGDDGSMTGLKMLEVPNASPESSNFDDSQVSLYGGLDIDWHAPIPTTLETSHHLTHLSKGGGVPAAPHVRHISRDTAFSTAPSVASFASFSSGTNTFFDYTVRPLKNRSANAKIPKLDIRQDLLFSLPQKRGVINWHLERLVITIPFGKPERKRPTLMDTYDGPGATIVNSFVRFNAVLTFPEKEAEMIITIVPRGKPRQVNQISDLSFLLSGIMVAEYINWDGPNQTPLITINAKEEYTGRDALETTFTCRVDLLSGQELSLDIKQF